MQLPQRCRETCACPCFPPVLGHRMNAASWRGCYRGDPLPAMRVSPLVCACPFRKPGFPGHVRVSALERRAALVDPSRRRHDRRMTDAVITAPLEREPRWRAIWRNAFPFLVVGALWEAVARAQVFPARLFPSLEAISATFVRL